jgi:hypothetical protein
MEEKMFQKITALFILIMLLVACSPAAVEPTPPEAPGAPAPGNGEMRGNVFIEQTNLLTMESFPPQFMLQISGNLPDPCHELRVQVDEPDADNRIFVEAFSVVDPDAMCIQVLEPFQENVNLGSFPEGEYTVFLNGEEVTKFRTP